VKTISKTSEDTPKPEHANGTTAKTSEKLPRLAYSMRETAEILRVSYITVHRLLKRGKLRASDAIRSKIIPRTEIDRFLRDSIADKAA
jgi:excisionase family DNA binding protein